jgi:methionyl-tRNA formyltransferase/peptidoglycan/xylan/chitin deacetylase (PgdA/CDA1 family)
LRIVVFTANPRFEHTPWWDLLLRTSGTSSVLLCRQLTSRRLRDVWRRQRRNVAKHGLIWIPYRAGALLLAMAGRLIPRRAAVAARRVITPPVPCEVVETLDIHSPETLAQVRDWRPDLGVSIGAPILRPPLFQIPAWGTINLHLGKLPEFRGAPPGFWELYTDAREIGATVHWIDAGLDTGPIIARASAPICGGETLACVEARAAELGRWVLGDALRRLARGERPEAPQPAAGQTYRQPTLRQRARLALRLSARRWRRRAARPGSFVKQVGILVFLTVARPVRDFVRRVRGRHPVRVYTFHRVSDLSSDGMTVSPDVFGEQLAYIRKYHDVVDLDRALALVQRAQPLRRPVAVITFDDGYRSVFEHARPIMARLGVPGTCFVSSDLVGTARRFAHDADSPTRDQCDVMGWEELAALRRAGWCIGGHTATHPRLARCDSTQLDHELGSPRDMLRARLGLTAVAMAYPFGGQDDITAEVRALVQRAGYTACFSNFGGENFVPADCFTLRRIDLDGDHPAPVWKALVHGVDLYRWRERWHRIRLRRSPPHAP